MNQNIEIVSLTIVILIQSMHFFLKHGVHQIRNSEYRGAHTFYACELLLK